MKTTPELGLTRPVLKLSARTPVCGCGENEMSARELSEISKTGSPGKIGIQSYLNLLDRGSRNIEQNMSLPIFLWVSFRIRQGR